MALDLVVLCAGRGDRLRPLTDSCPKPLLPVLGTAMADRALMACEGLFPVRRIANAHHLPDQIQVWAEARCLDHVQVEPELLDTGGALGRLESRGELQSEHVLVHNGDLLHDIDLREAWKEHLASGAEATLVCVDNPRVNTVAIQGGRFRGVLGHPRGPVRCPPDGELATFSGIAFYRRRVFRGRPDRPWSVKEVWHDLLEKDAPIRVWKAPSTAAWSDLGTAADFVSAVRRELSLRGLVSWTDPLARVSEGARVLPGSVVEMGTELGEGACVEECVLLPGARVAPGERVVGVLRNGAGDLGFPS